MPPAKKKASKKPAARKPAQKAAPKGKKPASKKPANKKPAAKKPAAAATIAGSPAASKAVKPRVHTPASDAERFAIEAARLLHDDKCTDIVLLDVRGRNPMTDYLVVGSGTSDRQMRSTLHDVEELGAKIGYTAVRSTSDDRATWLLADFMNVIVHLFEPNTRAHYDIEMMWGDAPRIPWERPGSAARDRAGLNSVEA
ncbi:MAG TPA: ribosome silencing factor [Phycisphaerales bacterium]